MLCPLIIINVILKYVAKYTVEVLRLEVIAPLRSQMKAIMKENPPEMVRDVCVI